jgi:hypothetical protein
MIDMAAPDHELQPPGFATRALSDNVVLIGRTRG